MRNNNANISKLVKALLMRKLKRDNIDISKEELEEVLETYNHLLDFYLEDSVQSTYYRFGFVGIPKNLFETYDAEFLKIFSLIIRIKQNNLLKYLDYILLMNNYKYGGNRLNELNTFLKDIIERYNESEPNDDFIYGLIKEHEYLLQDMVDNYLKYINTSDYIPQEYKDIMNLYDKLITNYYLQNYDEIDPDAFFQEYINMTYYYFLINDLFNKEPEKILSYLKELDENMISICDKLNMDGEMEYKDRIKYIDTLYNGRNKLKIIK